MPKTMTVDEQVEAAKAKASANLPAKPEVTCRLKRRASGNFQNSFAGQLMGGDLAIRVALGKDDPSAYRGELFDVNIADLESAEDVPSRRTGTAKHIVWRNVGEQGAVVQAWLPGDLTVTGFSILIG